MTTMFADLQGKTALITGASGGLGRHFASVLAAHGVRVAVAARRKRELEAVAAELSGKGGGVVVPVALDVTDAASVRTAIETTVRELGHIDILVNNSGVSSNSAVLEQTESDWDRVLDTNLKGAFLMSTEVARQLKAAGRPGSIINIASVLGLRQASHVTPYAASKAGLIQLTKQLALELARVQIRVNAIAPGYVLTDINREFFATDAGAQMIKRIPQRRLGNFEDLDGPLLLLASNASSYMTGAVLAVDGGHLVNSL
jgi:NAD(P)-dependent dehydrogenase (short-subunit alcohol dehydrogenase family)